MIEHGRLTVSGAEGTVRLGEIFGKVATAGLVIGLHGRIGAGKTTFVGGLARGLGLSGEAQSPTFTLVTEHLGGRLPLYHIDLYRLGQTAIDELDWLDEYLYGEGVCAMEWAELVRGALPAQRMDLRFLDPISEDEAASCRTVELNAYGMPAIQVLKELLNLWPS